VSHLNEENLG